MKIGRMKKSSIFLALFIVLCDRLLKILANKSLLSGSIGVIHFTRLHNYGATMGIFRGDRFLLTGIGMVVIVALGIVWFKFMSRSVWFWIGWALLMGGAVGNLLDRVMYGYVTDMLQVPFYPAIFNVADVAIRAGIVLVLIGYWSKSRENQ